MTIRILLSVIALGATGFMACSSERGDATPRGSNTTSSSAPSASGNGVVDMVRNACMNAFKAAGYKDSGDGALVGVFSPGGERVDVKVKDFEAQRIRVSDLTAADHANGIEWKGEVDLKYVIWQPIVNGPYQWTDNSVLSLRVRNRSGVWEHGGPGNWSPFSKPFVLSNLSCVDD